jgi:ribokinase
VDGKGQNSIMVIPGANAKLLPKDLEAALPLLRSAGMLLAQLEIPLETVEYLCEIAHRYHVPLMLDPAPARALPRTIVSRVAFLTPNETESCTLCGIPVSRLNRATAAECAKKLQAKGAANVIVKMGARGAYVVGSDGLLKMVPSFKVPVVDTTAAGDAFNAGLAVAVLRGLSLEEAVRYAVAVGAVSVTRAGAQPAMPTAEEVERLLAGKQSAESKTSSARAVK